MCVIYVIYKLCVLYIYVVYVLYIYMYYIYNIMHTTSNQESSISGGQEGGCPPSSSQLIGV